MSSEDEEMDCDTQSDKTKYVIPPMSQVKYNKAYQQFQKWNKANGCGPITEDLMIKYFEQVASRSKPSTLFAIYSMLKSTFRIIDNLDVSKYGKLLEYLKEKNAGYEPIRAKIFTNEEIDKFIKEAPDDRWLDVKVVCIFGVSGAYITKKLVNVLVNHIKRYNDMMLVTIPKTDTTPAGTFTITGTYFRTVQRYAELRPKNASTDRFFLNYHDEKCTAQPIGKNKFGAMPRRIATYLKLSEPERYAGLSFRRNSNNSYGSANTWNSMPVADEPTEDRVGLDHQSGRLKQPAFSSFSYSPTYVPAVIERRIFAAVNGNHNSTGTEHVCSLACGQVQCALEENESSVFHAFSIMKPSEYVIRDVTPAVYPSEPVCRWIVAYNHNRDEIEVSAFNADEAFDEITKSIPNNVRINQKYIRGTSSLQSMAAYVVVYGVNCKCHKETLEVRNGVKLMRDM